MRGRRGCRFRLVARRASGGRDTWYCTLPEYHGGIGDEHETEGGHRKWVAIALDTHWQPSPPTPAPPGMF